MISPYSSKVLQPLYVQNQSNRKFLIDQAQSIPSIVVSSAAAANAVMLGGGYFTPLEAEGKDETFISRIREDKTILNGLNLWIVSDNLLRGAALNAVEIAETLIKNNFYGK